MQLTNQWEEYGERRGQEQGIRIGEQRASRAILVRLLTRKFNHLPATLHEQINKLSQDKLEPLADAVLDFSTVADVQFWLARNG